MKPFGLSPITIVFGKVYVGQNNWDQRRQEQREQIESQSKDPELPAKGGWKPLTED
jgi:hypothetical protein